MTQQQIGNLKDQCVPLLEHFEKLRDQNEHDSPRWWIEADRRSEVLQFIQFLTDFKPRKD